MPFDGRQLPLFLINSADMWLDLAEKSLARRVKGGEDIFIKYDLHHVRLARKRLEDLRKELTGSDA